ncbi:MAG: bifunctional 4-hydroxy-2-oxoglutarate aldolase/2-dehydro-3-deoxy-phosphogluconate aldolase [Chloroflexota bacterium]|jgi:2-dehydro-3-deoxyphosphogluconate aldolase/(4S)-4-hydroxy-2-oxoglutarate aldolase
MAKYRRLEVLNNIMETGLVPIFYHSDLSVARRIVAACTSGGARVIEFTNRGDGAWRLFDALLEYRLNSQMDIMLGAGSIVDAATAALYVNIGADFIVGPMFNREIAELCNRRKVAYIPGCGTLTEISNAEAAGVELVKIFPGDVLGPGFVRAVHGPQPWTSMVVTGGVLPEEANIKEWFAAGAAAVGLGSKLIRHEWVSAGQYDKITATVSRILGWIR